MVQRSADISAAVFRFWFVRRSKIAQVKWDLFVRSEERSVLCPLLKLSNTFLLQTFTKCAWHARSQVSRSPLKSPGLGNIKKVTIRSSERPPQKIWRTSYEFWLGNAFQKTCASRNYFHLGLFQNNHWRSCQTWPRASETSFVKPRTSWSKNITKRCSWPPKSLARFGFPPQPSAAPAATELRR